MTGQRTYWHLEPLRRRPGDYDIATSRLLYYPQRGFAVHGSAEDWYRRYQRGSALQCRDWGRFRDPRETMYASYVEQGRGREAFVDGLLRAADDGEHDRGLPVAWLEVLARFLGPVRFALHGLQMITAYVAQMAPEGRIAVAGTFQVGDEMRRIQRLSLRLAQLQVHHPGLAGDGRRGWEDDAAWQPLREVIERLLVCYDWGEAFVALCLVVKPALDEVFALVGAAARAAGDPVLHGICFSLAEDCAWHRAWAGALTRVALEDDPGNRAHVAAWIGAWWPPSSAAMVALAPVLAVAPHAIDERVEHACRGIWTSLELEAP